MAKNAFIFKGAGRKFFRIAFVVFVLNVFLGDKLNICQNYLSNIIMPIANFGNEIKFD